jgi:protein-tyrosine phosphatase
VTQAGVFHVLHVCTGNICRSPMAQQIMRAELDRRLGARAREVVVSSAGTYGGYEGGPMHPPAAAVLAAWDYPTDGFHATWLREPQVSAADLVLVATADHRRQVLQLEPRALRRTFTWKELARLAEGVDPWALPAGGPAARFEALVEMADERRALLAGTGRFDDDVDDPYGGPPVAYERAADEIRTAVTTVLALL